MGFIKKVNFGGLNLLSAESKLLPEEYPLLINGRVRYNQIESILKPLLISTGLPAGNYQSIASLGDILFVFIDGRCYYTQFPTIAWVNLPGFLLDASVTEIFTQGVPVSTSNYVRKPVDPDNKKGGVTLEDSVTSSARGIVCQDGINQPHFITPDVTSKVLGTYGSWSLISREYVPVGRQMAFVNGILYVVAPERKEIYRSVTGRPLDFMVNIDIDGNKTGSELEGGAPSVSHAVDFNDITSIAALKSKTGEFFVGTLRSSYVVIPNFNSTIFAEPTFINDPTAETGPTNHYSLTSAIDGDMVFIDSFGVRSIKAILSLEEDGVNSPFSSAVQKLFEDITQDITACINFNNYIYFAVDTIYGPASLVYDTITQAFVGIDIYEGVAAIRQYIVLEYSNSRVLIFITTDGRVYQSFASTERETVKYLVSGISTLQADSYSTLQKLYVSFSDIRGAGDVQVEYYANRKLIATGVKSLSNIGPVPTFPHNIPYSVPYVETSECLTFQFSDEKITAWESSALISWNADAALNTIYALTDEQLRDNTNHLEEVVLSDSELTIALTADGGLLTSSIQLVVNAIAAHSPDYIFNIGDTVYAPDTFNTIVRNGPWKKFFDSGVYIDSLGNHELDISSGADYLNATHRGNNGRYYNKAIGNGLCELFIANSGINTADAGNVESDGNTAGSIQERWLDSRRASSSAIWKFCSLHHPPYSSSNLYRDYTELRWDFRNYDAVLCGHAHFYERWVQDNKNYITVGAGGNGFRSDYDSPLSVNSKKRYGLDYSYIILTLNAKVAKFTTYSLSAGIVDEVILRK